MTKHVTIDLSPADPYRRSAYGVLMTSQTEHYFTGRGIHNPSHRHSLDVWENKVAHQDGRSRPYVDPHGQPTSERYSFLWSPHSIVVSAARSASQDAVGVTLQRGDVVKLRVHGYVLGDFQVRSRPRHDPHMVQVDVESSASRQHFIDTGDYLPVSESHPVYV